MGQEVRAVPEDAALSEAPGGPEDSGIGPFLAQQRRLRGISLDQLAARTKIPRRSIERLESGAFDRGADGFTRGFVRAVAAELGLDPDDAVVRLLNEPPDEDAAESAARRRWRRSLALTGALVLTIGVAWLAVWGLDLALSAGPEAEPDAELLYRRDAVRALADSVDEPTPPSPAEESALESAARPPE